MQRDSLQRRELQEVTQIKTLGCKLESCLVSTAHIQPISKRGTHQTLFSASPVDLNSRIFPHLAADYLLHCCHSGPSPSQSLD